MDWMEFDEHDQFAAIFDALERKALNEVKITLKETSFMKLFCDSYYLSKIMKPTLTARPPSQQPPESVSSTNDSGE